MTKGGQKRRVAIAGVLAMQPKVLILDEPTAGLDPKGRDRILGQIQEYQQDQKNTVLIVSHSMEDVAKFAKKVLVMNQSKVFMLMTPKVFAHASEIEQMGLAVPRLPVSLCAWRRWATGQPHTYTIKAAMSRFWVLFDQKERIPQKCLDITIGQYFPGHSFIHKMTARRSSRQCCTSWCCLSLPAP